MKSPLKFAEACPFDKTWAPTSNEAAVWNKLSALFPTVDLETMEYRSNWAQSTLSNLEKFAGKKAKLKDNASTQEMMSILTGLRFPVWQ